MKTATALVLLVLSYGAWSAQLGDLGGDVVVLYPDQDFEKEPLAWGFWPEQSKTVMALDREVVQHGSQSLRMTAVDAADRGFALGGIGNFEPGVVYRITVHLRKDPAVADSALSFFINYREGPDKPIRTRQHPKQIQRDTVGNWQRWTGYFVPPQDCVEGQFLLGVEHTIGRVWWDNIIIERLADPATLETDVWTQWTLGVEVGAPPLKRFARHQSENTPVFQMATRFNELLWRSALLERNLRDLERCAAYAGKPDTAPARMQFSASEDLLNEAYRTYVTALRADAQDIDPSFTSAAQKLEAALKQLEQIVTSGLAAATEGQAGVLPTHLGRQPRDIAVFGPGGRMNRLLWGAWSPTNFVEMEQRFDFEFHSSAPGSPKVHTETTIDLSNVTESCDRLEALGFRGTFGYLGFGIHQYMYAPQWLMDKFSGEPDFAKLSWDGLTGQDRGSSRNLNYFHPAVKQYIADYLKRYAEFCRNEPRILFHEVAQEAYPYFTVSAGRRLISYGPHMVREFRRYLQGKYESVEALNREWGTEYASFEAIDPPPDPNVQPWTEPSPLTCELAAFAEKSYLDYLKLIYDSLKAGDPDKPVVARHSGALLSAINGARIWETCDILSFHTRAPRMNMMNHYLNSLHRYGGGGLGYMEDFWGVQEEADRVHDERAQRRGLEKHVAREGLWGRTLQMKWYGYTTGKYVFTYNGNWLNVANDLTTWRYCAPALAVAKQKLEHLDWMLTHSRIARSKLLVLQPSASMRNQAPANPPFGEILGLHDLLTRNGLLYELLPEEYVSDGRCSLAEFSVVMLPKATYLSADLQSKLAQFVRQGGTLVCVGAPGEKDELARPSGRLMAALAQSAGANWASVRKAFDSAEAGLVMAQCGTGRIAALQSLAAVLSGREPDALAQFLVRMTPRPDRCEGNRIEVMLRIAEDGGRYVCLLNPSVDETARDVVHIGGPLTSATDVTVPGGCAVPVENREDGGQFAVRLGPGEMTVIYLQP